MNALDCCVVFFVPQREEDAILRSYVDRVDGNEMNSKISKWLKIFWPIPFTLNVRRKLRIPILPYECKCQCNKTYDIYGDHPFNCPKNHKGRPHNMITNKFSKALAPLLTTANIISPTTNLDKEINLHLPADPTPYCTSLRCILQTKHWLPSIECLFNDRLRYHNYQCHSSTPLQPCSSIVYRLYHKLHC